MLKPDIIVDSLDLKATIKSLKEEQDYTILLDITAVDYLQYPDVTPSRFGVIYILRTSDF